MLDSLADLHFSIDLYVDTFLYLLFSTLISSIDFCLSYHSTFGIVRRYFPRSSDLEWYERWQDIFAL